VLEELAKDPSKATYDLVELMNEKPFAGTYTTHHTGLQFEPAQPGELYIQTQSGGGGYGDVLERDPELVMKDLREELISEWVARNVYRVAFDAETLLVDDAETRRLRDEERRARCRRGRPFAEFEKAWTKAAPPAGVPYYGSWERPDEIYAGGPEHKTSADAMQGVYL
jgi:hypothetical protein